MNVDEKRISEFAYQIWQSEGEPEGEELRHWEIASKLAEAESSSSPVHVEDSHDGALSIDAADRPDRDKNGEAAHVPRPGGGGEQLD